MILIIDSSSGCYPLLGCKSGRRDAVWSAGCCLVVGMTFMIDSSSGCQPMMGCKSGRRDAASCGHAFAHSHIHAFTRSCVHALTRSCTRSCLHTNRKMAQAKHKVGAPRIKSKLKKSANKSKQNKNKRNKDKQRKSEQTAEKTKRRRKIQLPGRVPYFEST